MTELIPVVKMETRHPVEGSFGREFSSICNRCRVMAAGSRKTWYYGKNFAFFFLEKPPFTGKFTKLCSKRIHCDIDRRVVFKFREIWLMGNL